jgi:hypothetical protein
MPDIKDKSFTELQEMAKERDIRGWYSMNKQKLIIALGYLTDPEKEVHDRTIGVSDRELAEIEKKRNQMPGKTIYWKKDKELVMEIINRNPFAFNDYDLTDARAPVIHHFETSNKNRKVNCICGEKFKIGEYAPMERKDKSGKMVTVPIEGPTDRHYCQNCGKLHVYHSWKDLESEGVG